MLHATFSLSLIQSVPLCNVLIIGSGYIAMVVTRLYNYRKPRNLHTRTRRVRERWYFIRYD